LAEIATLREAVAALVSDGAVLAMEGFTHLIPFAAGHEVIRQGRKSLTLVRMTPDLIYDQMIGMGHQPASNASLRDSDFANQPLRGKGPTVVITDLGVLVPDPETSEFTLVALHPSVTVEEAKAATGWELKVAKELEETPAPTEFELKALRELYARTEAAHGAASTEG
jgi:hypothetical protein